MRQSSLAQIITSSTSQISIWYAGASFVIYAVKLLSATSLYGHGATDFSPPGNKKDMQESELWQSSVTGSVWNDIAVSLSSESTRFDTHGPLAPWTTSFGSYIPRPPLISVQLTGI
jgi:hypothetical protein